MLFCVLEAEGEYRKEGLREGRRTKSRGCGGVVCNLWKNMRGLRGIA